MAESAGYTAPTTAPTAAPRGYSGRQRAELIERLERRVFDLVIIGGGINGAAIARDAALRGYSVALIEMQDFAEGTSSRSSRLIHGGLRYLEHAEFALVFESLSERTLLARIARHLVRPLHFVFPVYSGARRGLFTASVGMWLYDVLAMFRNHRRHSRMSPDDLARHVPKLRQHGLKGAVAYYDYQTDDARLVLENVISAVEAGAVCCPRLRAEAYEGEWKGQKRLLVRDLLTDRTFTVHARAGICAAGPWTDDLVSRTKSGGRHWLRPTKGVHMVVPGDRVSVPSAIVMQHPNDSRVLFALPYHERTVIGTTDTFFEGSPSDVHATSEDIDYLLAAAGHYFPDAKLTRDDVISTWAGIRPLVAEDKSNPGAVSREHRILARNDGMVVIAGGKLTTYRRMAAECVDTAIEIIADADGPRRVTDTPTGKLPLPGAEGLDSDADLEALTERVSAQIGDHEVGEHLVLTYGARAMRVARLAERDGSLRERIADDLPFVWAQIAYAARDEMALTLADALVRRTHVFYRDRDQGLGVLARAADVMGRELGWDAAERERQLTDYRAEVEANRGWRSASERAARAAG
ncbi:MAG: glycerol-3-phosphate dehydrogenase/oxidase [Myxococcales bacterium]|nr:glycerol-3-phosphate dehydrogenase/oxidase [Myxococcales bacterium]